jgi:hypothetical protein
MKFTIETWQQLGIIAGMAITVLATLAASLWLSRQTITQARRLWLTVRGHGDEIMSHIDEPTDTLPQLAERYLGVPAPVVSAFLTALMRTLLTHLDIPEPEPASRADESTKETSDGNC